MIIIKQIGDFIVSSWIWQFTEDWFHPVLSGIIMFFLLRLIMRRKRLQSLLIAVSLQLIALAFLCFIALGLFVHLMRWKFEVFEPHEGIKYITILWPSLGLGLLYAIFQTVFFLGISLFWRINLLGFIVITWISNGIGAMLSYMLIRMVDVLKYVR